MIGVKVSWCPYLSLCALLKIGNPDRTFEISYCTFYRTRKRSNGFTSLYVLPSLVPSPESFTHIINMLRRISETFAASWPL